MALSDDLATIYGKGVIAVAADFTAQWQNAAETATFVMLRAKQDYLEK